LNQSRSLSTALGIHGDLDETRRQDYTFKDFAQALAFANKVGAVAEAEGHHPDLFLAWGKCKIEIWSHKIKGLTESDFVLAAKAEQKFKPFHAPA
jgi:4a-hydroxytetrahydrobiopterin dehydratase